MKKLSKKDWDLNVFETFLICYAIGITVYISICFIIDIFEFFNFYSAYLSIAIFNSVFLCYLSYRKNFNRKKIIDSISSLKYQFSKNSKEVITFAIILIFIISIQIWIQWEITIKEYAISSKDTYVWLGDSWYLLEKGKLWRDHLRIQYPRGFTFFLAAPELIFPDFRFAYFYMKFVGIPFFSFYIFTIAILLNRIFKKNYLVFMGLLLILCSNYLFSRFISFTSSAICTLLILISLIILYSKCPFYLTGFIIISTFLLNALFAIFYVIVLAIMLLTKLIYLDKTIKTFFINNIAKPLVIIFIFLIPWILHTIIVQNLSVVDYIIYFDEILGISYPTLPQKVNIEISNMSLLQLRYILEDFFPHNEFIFAFIDIQKRMLSYFFIFALIIIFFPTNRFFNKKFWDLINFGKISTILIIGMYLIEIFLLDYSFVFFSHSDWFKFRAVEGFTGPVLITVCFIFVKIIEKAKLLTTYFTNRSNGYKRLINTSPFSIIFKIENILITIVLISILSASFANRRIYTSYYFEQDQIETIFYIKENIPEDSKILVSDFGNGPNCLYSLLSTYDFHKWDFEFDKNTFNETLEYIIDERIEYILLDYTMINSTEKGYFTGYSDFDKMYENEYNIVFDVDI